MGQSATWAARKRSLTGPSILSKAGYISKPKTPCLESPHTGPHVQTHTFRGRKTFYCRIGFLERLHHAVFTTPENISEEEQYLNQITSLYG